MIRSPLSKLVVYPVCALALAAPSAYAKVNFYGTLIPTLESFDDFGDGAAVNRISSNGTFFGFKGSNGLNNGMKLFYEVDWNIDVSDGGQLTPRNQKIGVSGSKGSVFVGQHDTPLRELALKVDLFDEMTGDIAGGGLFAGEARPNNIIYYTSPKLQGGKLQVMAAYVLSEVDGADNGTSFAGTYRTGKITAGIAMDDSIEGDNSTTRIMGQYDGGKWVVGGLYQTTEDADGNNGTTSKLISGTYRLDSKSSIRAQLVDQSNDNNDNVPTALSVAYDMKLGSKTKAFAFYSSRDNGADDPEEQTVFGIGIHHKF